jgi:peptidyl-tRNA hydrolase, PTH1 family
MKYLIVGLGNPGVEYKNTRHNVGFKTLDTLAKVSNVVFNTAKLADRAVIKFKGRTLILIKPTTYMNLSGKAVNYWMKKEGVSIENTLVITDDLALPYGKLRLKPKGSAGGHNGLKDIQEVLGSNVYARLRFGIGDEFSKGNQIDFVLGKWSEIETDSLDEKVDLAIEIIKSFATAGVQRTMNDFNSK